MSETRKRGRPKKTESSSERDVMLEALAKAQQEIEALKTVNRYSEKPVVLVRASGYGPQLILPIDGEKSVVLDPHGSTNKVTIPLSDYINIKKTTDWVAKGYLYSEDDIDDNNPNLIIDIPTWFKNTSEKNIISRVNKVESQGLLNALYDFTEPENRTSKMVTLRNAVARRMEVLFDIIVLEDQSLDRATVGN